MELLKHRTKSFVVHVPYRGTALAVQDVISGQVPMMVLDTAAGLPQIRSGKVRALAVMSKKRIPSLPDVPTLDELGYKGVDFSVWFGVVGPAGLPPEIAKRVSDGVDWAIRQPDVVEKLLVFGFEPAAQTSAAALKGRIDSDLVRYSPVIRKLGFKLD